MAEQRKIKRKAKRRTAATKRTRVEHRFLPRTTTNSMLIVGLGMVGALLLGAGVFGQWVREESLEYAQYLVLAGALGLGAALWFGDVSGTPVRVGDAGIALEKSGEVLRLGWCEIEKVFIKGGQLIAQSEELTLAIPLAAHPNAAAWVLSEGTRRLPEIMNVKRSESRGLPKPQDNAGEELTIEGVQLAGRYCRKSEKLISFERDARVCPNCAEVYHRDNVPEKCLTCDQPLGTRAMQV